MPCLFVNHLTVADFAYLDSARGLVGESWIVDIELEGDLDEQSMVLDFGAVKKRIKRAIDDSIDHTLVVPLQAEGLQWEPHEQHTRLLFPSALGAIEHVGPPCAVSPLDCAEITTDSAARTLESLLMPLMPESVHALRITLRPERIDGAFYHYSHGLRKHDGACQRIAHGHRSRLVVELDGQRQTEWERDIALAWTDVYLGVREDITAQANGRLRFAYDAPEGHFELALPEHCVDILDTDSTVECIASTLDARIRQRAELPSDARLRVCAFEGVDKGAIAGAR